MPGMAFLPIRTVASAIAPSAFVALFAQPKLEVSRCSDWLF